MLGATFGDVRLWSLYVPNGQSVDSDKYRYKLDWLAALRVLLADELARHPRCCSSATSTSRPTIATSTIPRRGAARSCARRPSARRSASLCDLGLRDTFRLFPQPEKVFSWWDYRAGRVSAQPRA